MPETVAVSELVRRMEDASEELLTQYEQVVAERDTLLRILKGLGLQPAPLSAMKADLMPEPHVGIEAGTRPTRTRKSARKKKTRKKTAATEAKRRKN